MSALIADKNKLPDHGTSAENLLQGGETRVATLAQVILNDATRKGASAVRFSFDGHAAVWEFEVAGEWQRLGSLTPSLWPKLVGALLIFAGIEYWQTGPCTGVISRQNVKSTWTLSTESRWKLLILRREDGPDPAP